MGGRAWSKVASSLIGSRDFHTSIMQQLGIM